MSRYEIEGLLEHLFRGEDFGRLSVSCKLSSQIALKGVVSQCYFWYRSAVKDKA